jgi:hypothetical protein
MSDDRATEAQRDDPAELAPLLVAADEWCPVCFARVYLRRDSTRTCACDMRHR